MSRTLPDLNHRLNGLPDYTEKSVSSVSSVAIRDSDVRMTATLNLPPPTDDHRKIYRRKRRMGALLSGERNQSRSFQVFLAGVRRLVAAMGDEPPSGRVDA